MMTILELMDAKITLARSLGEGRITGEEWIVEVHRLDAEISLLKAAEARQEQLQHLPLDINTIIRF